ncbi:MAG: pilus assembly PilX N-terminal domain-containing protein, partial [Terriglobia bacterium]
MKQEKISRGLRNLRHRVHSKGRGKEGVALITALIFLGVTMLLGLSIMLTTSSDVFISGTMRNSKNAFYAADAGVSVMRTALVNALKNATPASVANGSTQPFDCGDANFWSGIKNTALGSAGGGSSRPLGAHSSYGDSTAAFAIDTGNDGGRPRTSFSCVGLQSTWSPPPPLAPPSGWEDTYTLAYQITSNGTAGGPASSTVTESGTIVYKLDIVAHDSSTDYFNLLFSF